MISHRDLLVRAAAPELLEACRLFTQAAHDARDILNNAGLACPASIALAAEKARHAIRMAEPVPAFDILKSESTGGGREA
jgi:hypothetical protein